MSFWELSSCSSCLPGRSSAKPREIGIDMSRNATLLRKYGITEAQYNAMLARQGYVCALCGREPAKRRLAVDHDHADGRVRGLLCYSCNRFIAAKNTYKTANALFEYLVSRFDGRKL